MRWGLTLETASGLEDASGFVAIVARGVAKDGFNPGIGERMDQEEKSLLAIASKRPDLGRRLVGRCWNVRAESGASSTKLID